MAGTGNNMSVLVDAPQLMTTLPAGPGRTGMTVPMDPAAAAVVQAQANDMRHFLRVYRKTGADQMLIDDVGASALMAFGVAPTTAQVLPIARP